MKGTSSHFLCGWGATHPVKFLVPSSSH